MDRPSPLISDGLPYLFTSFASDGTLANGSDVLAGKVAILDPTLAGRHTQRMPMELQVIRFPPRRHNGH